MYRNLILCLVLGLTLEGFVEKAHSQAVTLSYEELALDGSNIDTSGLQVLGANPSNDDVLAAGVDWSLNEGNFGVSGASSIGDRNNTFQSETFAPGSQATGDAYFDPGNTGSESDLHNALEDILFGRSIDFSLSGLVLGHDYRMQLISWDAGVEGEGDGTENTTKEYRYSTITATGGATGSLEYSQFVTDGFAPNSTPADGLFGNSSDEITAALITGIFTATSSDISFNMAVTAGSANDNAIFTGVVLHDLTVPEPCTALIASMGMLCICLKRRR